MQIYSAESQAKNFRVVFKHMALGLVGSRYSAYRLFLRDVKAEYSKSKFGLFWDFLDPLVFAMIFYGLEKAGFLNKGDIGMPYVVFIIHGFLLYQTFSDALILSMDVIRRGKTILTQLKLPPECLLLSVVIRVFFNASFRIAIILLISLSLDAYSWIGLLKFSILFPVLILAGLAAGILLAPFNVVYNDVGRVARIILTPLRFGTPVMYAIPRAKYEWIYTFNPIAHILDSLRSLAVHDQMQDPAGFALRVMIMLAVFVFGWFVFHISIPVLAERA